MTEILSLDSVGLSRQHRTVIDAFSLNIKQGDFIALIGSNGSGKTTLLKMIMGFLKPENGAVKLFGETVYDFHHLRKRIGYVPQAFPVDFKMPMSVREVVAMGRYGLAGIGHRLKDTDHIIIENALRDVGISQLEDRPIGHLSGGEYQKVQIARALCQTPELLLLDEPTSNLDLGAQRECLDLIIRLHNTHKLTTMIVMHDLKSLPAICNRAIIIDGGLKVFDGPFGEVLTESNLAHIYKNQAPQVLSALIEELTVKNRLS
ncbi:MAG: metal ABC transporter ATP-binding protein [Candidatus Latescibacteria bacterium]|nr:metal ABC transporter ATP-binding protein [Candidatus Latescibacterota bacterium]